MATRRLGRSVVAKVSFPEDTYYRLERILTNQFQRPPVYGQRSQIITQIVNSWLTRMEAKQAEEAAKQKESAQ